jgi:hypothetical protein
MLTSSSRRPACCECQDAASDSTTCFSFLINRSMKQTFAPPPQLHYNREDKVAPAAYVECNIMAVKNKLRLISGELTQEQRRVISDVVGKHVATKKGALSALVNLFDAHQVSDRSSETMRELQSINDKFERVRCVLGMVPEEAPASMWAVQSPTCGSSPTSLCRSSRRRRSTPSSRC